MFRLTRKITKKTLSKLTSNLNKIPKYQFSSISTDKSDLREVLNNEITYETEEVGQSENEFLEKFMSETDWEYKSSLDCTKLELTKTVDNQKVTVVFSAKSPDYQPEEGEEKNPSEEEQQEQNYTDFMVIVDNQNKSQIVFELLSVDGEISVNNVFPTTEGESFLMNKTLSYTTTQYTGPLFETLDENLQDKVMGYLNSLGVNEDLSVFIETASQEHESQLYKKWLEDFRDFLN